MEFTRHAKPVANGKSTVAEVMGAPVRMAAAVFTGARHVRVERVGAPEPGPGQVRVRLEGCGLCGSNLPVWQGREWFKYPLEAGAPGHEGWGFVDAVGEGVETVTPGARVAVLSYHAYAQYDIAPVENVVELPFALERQPFPGEPLGCAMNIMRRAAVTPGETVAVIGIGFLGALLVQLAAGAGARVIAIARRPCALSMARYLGAAETILMDDHWEILDQVRALTGGAGCDCVIESIGLQWPLDLAGELVRERGRIVIAGYHQDGPREVNMQLWNWKGLDVINAHERDARVYIQGIREAAAAVAEGRLTPAPLYTHAFSLGELARAFEMMEQRPDGFFKALVMV